MRFLTAGESHGPQLTVIVDNVPAGVLVSVDKINHQLSRRQVGFGRGGRMSIEKDKVQILSGVRFGKTTGGPVTMVIENRDFKNWESVFSIEGEVTSEAKEKRFMLPRPGHADLAAYYKYDLDDLRDALERSSARETAARVAAGALAGQFLNALGMKTMSYVARLGGLSIQSDSIPEGIDELMALVESNDLRAPLSDECLERWRSHVQSARKEGTTLGGDVVVRVDGVMPGLGSYVQWDRKLDGQLAQAVMSVQAVKSVSIGLGVEGGLRTGHEFHDAIHPTGGDSELEGALPVSRPTNRAGGLEGGVTNGESLVLTAVMKPISTLLNPLDSVNLETGEAELAHFERSDVTAVPACGVVCEAMVNLVLARAVMDKFGGDVMSDIQAACVHYKNRLR